MKYFIPNCFRSLAHVTQINASPAEIFLRVRGKSYDPCYLLISVLDSLRILFSFLVPKKCFRKLCLRTTSCILEPYCLFLAMVSHSQFEVLLRHAELLLGQEHVRDRQLDAARPMRLASRRLFLFRFLLFLVLDA